MTPLRFANPSPPSGWVEDLHLQAVMHARHTNNERLHSAIGYITPKDKLEGREKDIWSERDRKLHEARESRKQRRLQKR
jgi:hypothetical protein